MIESTSPRLLTRVVILVGGILAAAILGGITWLIVLEMTLGLPTDTRFMARLAPSVLAALCGFLIGVVIARRASARRNHLPAFSAFAAALGAGTAGAGVAVVITAAYLGTYGQMPDDILGRVLYIAAFPAFAALGWFCGAFLGLLAGFGGGALLRLVVHDHGDQLSDSP